MQVQPSPAISVPTLFSWPGPNCLPFGGLSPDPLPPPNPPIMPTPLEHRAAILAGQAPSSWEGHTLENPLPHDLLDVWPVGQSHSQSQSSDPSEHVHLHLHFIIPGPPEPCPGPPDPEPLPGGPPDPDPLPGGPPDPDSGPLEDPRAIETFWNLAFPLFGTVMEMVNIAPDEE